jgi:hypothetical protein
MGPSVAIGLGPHEVSWERPKEGDSRSSAVAPEEAAWIIWEDNSVQSMDVAPDDVSRMVALWSNGQPVPTELTEMIQKERSRQNRVGGGFEPPPPTPPAIRIRSTAVPIHHLLTF